MLHTSESLKAQDTDLENFHYQLDDGEQYKLTAGEAKWLEFVRGRYSIYDHIDSNSHTDDNGDTIYTVDCEGMGDALNDDGCDYKATCLSNDTTLQAIFFYSSYHDDQKWV